MDLMSKEERRGKAQCMYCIHFKLVGTDLEKKGWGYGGVCQTPIKRLKEIDNAEKRMRRKCKSFVRKEDS